MIYTHFSSGESKIIKRDDFLRDARENKSLYSVIYEELENINTNFLNSSDLEILRFLKSLFKELAIDNFEEKYIKDFEEKYGEIVFIINEKTLSKEIKNPKTHLSEIELDNKINEIYSKAKRDKDKYREKAFRILQENIERWI